MKKSILLILMCLTLLTTHAQVNTEFWRVDNLSLIGGNNIQVIGNPKIINTEIGDAVEFNGINDGLIVNNHPVSGATAFTIEIIFKPYSGGAIEQRFLHLQQDDNNRILIELRNNNNANWSLDTFIKSGSSSQALLDYAFVHNLNEWVHAALVFKDGRMAHYINGEKELEGTVNYQVVNSGQTSLGVRMNQVSWFKGVIHTVKVTHEALNPEGFMEIGENLSVENIEDNQPIIEIVPNPMESYGLLKYKLAESSNISIKLINIYGAEIANVFEGFKSAGTHELEITRNNINTGMYFVVINYMNKNFAQKMIVTN
ncbi:LamG-like jellyroll fold domain-containing protein [Mariniflexile soesokkakense]|uniref:LamG-like jellyroll fold domain-containing protein n=1 Tax=Mariniflexile soesokkakense TaxID=1343160 RepID=A0ABV0A9Y1_9FLAO